jgi:hypothetical protein
MGEAFRKKIQGPQMSTDIYQVLFLIRTLYQVLIQGQQISIAIYQGLTQGT